MTSGREFQSVNAENAPSNFTGQRIQGWNSAALNYAIELRGAAPGGEPSASGNQHVEVNASYTKTRMYQNICLIQGESLSYSYYHRGRRGTDTLEVSLYNSAGTSKELVLKTSMTDNLNWQLYSETNTPFSLPTRNYQFSFHAIGSVGANYEGNLLDDVELTLAPVITFSKAFYSASENSVQLPYIKINGTVPTGGMSIAVGVTTLGATEGSDFSLSKKSISIDAGVYTPKDSFQVDLSILDNNIVENDEEFLLTILSATNSGIISAGCGGYISTKYTILNDDVFEAGPNREVCPKETINLSATGSESPSWNNGIVQGIGFAAPKEPGEYLYIATDTSYSEPLAGIPFYKVVRDTVRLTVKSAPAPIVENLNICKQAAYDTLTAIGSTLLWFDDTLMIGSTLPPIINLNITDTLYKWVNQTTNGCQSDKASIQIAIKSLPPSPTISNTSICQHNGSITLSAIGTLLRWYSDSTGGISSADSPTFDSTIPDTVKAWVSQTVNDCEGPRAKGVLMIKALPTPPTVTNQVHCQGSGFIPFLSNGTDLKWYQSNNDINFTTNPPSANANTSGLHTTFVSQTINDCESPLAAVHITINPLPLAPVIASVSQCQKDASRSMVQTTDSLVWYKNPIDGVYTFQMPITNTQQVGTEDYWVSAIQKGCIGPRSHVTATIHPLPMVKISGTSSGGYCSRSTLPLTANGAVKYVWHIPNDQEVNQANYTVQNFSTLDTGKYSLTGTDNNGCIAKDSIFILLKNLPAISASPLSVCEKAPIHIVAEGTGTFFWKIPSGVVVNSSILSIPVSSYSDQGKYVVVSTLDGCTDSTEVSISVTNCSPLAQNDSYSIFSDEMLATNQHNHPILNDTDPNDSLLPSGFTLLTAPRYGQLLLNENGTWTYKPNSEIPAIEVLEYQICDQGQPVLCSTAKIEIEIKTRDAFFPDAITPNGDGINDTYIVYYLAPTVKVTLSIFNRWGDLVFQSNDYKNDWNGKCYHTACSGADLPVGTYFIVAELSNGNKFTSHLSLNR